MLFVGREREMQTLDAALSGLAAGRGALLLLTGEPGIGKTRLADELARRAAARGATVAWGAAWDGGDAPAYWPWIQVVRALRPLLPQPDEHLRRDLGPLWDERGQAKPETRDADLQRFRRFDALRALLALSAARAPLVVILEDVHAADRASLLALQFVARAMRSLPLLLLATHRDAEARLDTELGELLAKVARDGTKLALSRLRRDDVEQMMSDLEPVTPRLVDEIYAKSGGNPLFVDEMVRLVRTGSRSQVIPDGVGAVIHDRLARLPEAARAVLDAAGVIGREFEPAVLAEVCALAADELPERLRVPQLAGLVEEAGNGRLRFAHALYRERVYEDLAPAKKRSLHLRIGDALERMHADTAAESIARHLLAALPGGDAERAATWALRAGQQASRALAFDRAAELLEGALACIADPARHIDVELDLAEALSRTGASERSRSMCLGAADRARGLGDGRRLARSALVYGAVLRIAMVDPKLIALLRESLDLLGDADEKLRARVLARLAAAQQPALDPMLPMKEAREAIALARRLGDPDTLMTVLYTAGSALVDYAPADERLPLARELVAIAVPRGELVLAQRGYARMAVDCLELGDIAAADEAIAAYERLGQALGHPRWRWRGALFRSMRALMEGRWADADAAQAEARTLAAQAEDDADVMGSLFLHSIGAAIIRERMPQQMEVPIEGAHLFAPLLRGSLQVRLGDLEGARRSLAQLPLEHPVYRYDLLAVAGLAAIVIGVRERALAESVLAALLPSADKNGTWGVYGLIWMGPIRGLLGGLYALLERWDEAVAALEDALADAEAAGGRPVAARIRWMLADALVHRGESARARTLLESAGAEARALELPHLAAQIEASRSRLAPAPAWQPSPAPAFSMVREGDVWSISWAGRVARLKHSRALEILHQLVEQPGREFHVLDLSGAVDTGDAGEALDAEARKSYRARIEELEEELAEAEGWSDAGRCSRLRAELEFVREELARGSGLAGRERRSASAVERARVNVQKRLRGVIRKLAETLPELAHHLDTEIKTGTYVSYGRRVTM